MPSEGSQKVSRGLQIAYFHVFRKFQYFILQILVILDDLVILVSSSGRSPNIIKAAQKTRELKLKLVTLTGFDKNNPLKKLGDLNLWVDSRAYNIIENTHLIWLLAVNDLIFGNAEYTA